MSESARALHDGRRLAGIRVLVAGAGLAGLAAADALRRMGARVTVVEASDRLGGRVWTIREDFVGRQFAEGGADLIEPTQKPVLDLARSLGLSVVPILRRGFGYYGPDRRGRLAVQSLAGTFEGLSGICAPLVEAHRAADCRWDSVVAQRLAAMSVAEWLQSRRIEPALLERARSLRGLFLCDIEDLSLLSLVDFLSADPFSGDEAMYRVQGGNDRLATSLAKRLSSPVRTQAILRRLKQHDSGVVATIERRRQRAEWRGHFVICAIPATTLRGVEFAPPLPIVQRQALQRLPYGPATRVLLQFERRFWRQSSRRLAFASARSHGAVWDGNEHQGGRHGILSLLAGGGASQDIGRLLERRGLTGVIEAVAWLGAPARLLGSRVIHWEHEPWAQGGYACFTTAFDPRLQQVLARPAGRVMFAGEHTSREWQGYMSGAIESGQRAAAEVAAAAGRLP